MRFAIYKSVLMVLAFCVSAFAQEPVSGVQSPYSVQSDQTTPAQRRTRSSDNLKQKDRSATGIKKEMGAGAQGSIGGDHSQLCFVPGQGYISRTGETCPTGPMPEDSTKSADLDANAKTGPGTKPVLPGLTATNPALQQVMKASIPAEQKRTSIRDKGKDAKESKRSSQGKQSDRLCRDTVQRHDEHRSLSANKKHDTLCGASRNKQNSRLHRETQNAEFRRD